MQWVIGGIGGQGALFVARVIAQAGRLAGTDVIVGETHGMSQRGGAVLAFVKVGAYASAVIRPGAADIGLCLDPSQAAAVVGFLRRGGACAVSAAAPYAAPTEVQAFADQRALRVRACDARAIAVGAGAGRAHNVVLLGFAAALAPGHRDTETFRRALREVSPPAAQAVNEQLFEAGWAAATSAQEVRTDG